MDQNLNEKQIQAANKIDSFINQSTSPIFYLLGYAGSGKTFLIGQIITKLLFNNQIEQIYICAPTHQALSVIESAIKPNIIQNDILDKNKTDKQINFMTIHKLLEFKPIIMTTDGSKIFKCTKESKFLKQLKTKLIIIDECSMIPKEMVTELEKYVQLYSIKIIFMGDKNQLPPVGEPLSMVFTNIPTSYEHQILLDQIMRTKSPEIKEVCRIIRSWNKTDPLVNLLLPIHKKKLLSFKMYHKGQNYAESNWFKYTINKINKNQIPIILPWKNDTVNFYNTIVRNCIYPNTDLTNFVVGDYVIFNNFYRSIDDNYFHTSTMVKILELSEKQTDVLFDWTSLKIDNPITVVDKKFNVMIKKLGNISLQKSNFKICQFKVERVNQHDSKQNDFNPKQPDFNPKQPNFNPKQNDLKTKENDLKTKENDPKIDLANQYTNTIQTIHRSDLTRYETMINIIREHIEFFFKSNGNSELLTKKLWTIFHSRLIDPYAQIRLGYSTTIYKSQGSTFPIVIVDLNDMACLDANEFQLALYTAAGRAGNELRFII